MYERAKRIEANDCESRVCRVCVLRILYVHNEHLGVVHFVFL